jgi:hypothetical protein
LDRSQAEQAEQVASEGSSNQNEQALFIVTDVSRVVIIEQCLGTMFEDRFQIFFVLIGLDTVGP